MITGNLNVIPGAQEFALLFLKVLNIDFSLILITLNVVERSLLLKMTLVIVGVNGKMLNLMP